MQKWTFGLIVALFAVPLLAATFTGKVTSVDSDARTISVEGGKNGDESKTFEIPEKAAISLNNKKSDFDALTEGTSVTVTTDAKGKVTRINAKEAVAGKAATARKPAAKSEAGRATTGNSEAGDWAYFCGPTGDNVSTAKGLLQEWPDRGPAEAWRATGLGEGYSSVAVADGMVFTMGNVGASETVTAISLDSGDVVWQKETAQASKLSAGDGPRGTPTYDDGKVYSLGGNGDLTCLDAKTGEISWKLNILKEFKGNNITWGISESPLIDGEKLICTPGGSNGSIVALDKATGKPIWRSTVPGKSPAGYSSAIVAEVGGVRQYIQFMHAGTAGVRADNGDFLWGNNDSANGTANCSSPLFSDGMVFTASGYSKGGAMVKLKAAGKNVKATHVYHTNKMESHHGGMVLLDGHIYGSSDPGIVRCLDLATGKVKWENRSVGKGSITCAEGYLYIRSEQGPVALAKATPAGYTETGRFNQPDRSGAAAWAHPVVSHGKLFLRDQDLLLAYDVRDQKVASK